MRQFLNVTADARWVALGVPNPMRVPAGGTVAIHDACASAYERNVHWQPVAAETDQAVEAGKAEQ